MTARGGRLAPVLYVACGTYTRFIGMRAKIVALAILWAATATAQENAPPGFLRGDLQGWIGTSRSGQFTFRAAADRLYSCSFDEKTYFERDQQRITLAVAGKGDHLELLSDRRLGSTSCYARIVHILDPPPSYMVPGVRPHPEAAPRRTASFLPHGNLSLSGVVARLTADSLILRTRSGNLQVILLRPDTRYMTEGQTAGPASLPANTIVYIRGGRDLNDQIEAYQVIWGEILQPVR
jgi:hypothetical protein